MAFQLARYLETHGDLLKQFEHVKVRLIDHADSPFNLAIASARTCYSSRGIMLPGDMEKNTELRDKIAESTMQAGHLTTRQHAHFVFGIEGVSRHVIWQFLHAHPYYNSEQVSQRYVPIREGSWYGLPPALKLDEISNYHNETIAAYHHLIEALTPAIEEEFFGIYRARKNSREKYAGHIQKKAMEIARYVMPLSTTAYLYHTVSALTLYRYIRMMYFYRNGEITALLLKMLIEVEKVDPLIIREIPEPVDRSFEQPALDKVLKANALFDEKLAKQNTISRLVSAPQNPGQILAEVLSSVDPAIALALETDSSSENIYKIVDKILDPEKNKALADTLYPGTLDPKARILNHLHFTFQKKLSHTADSQEQRHRTLPGSRPVLSAAVSLEAEYVTPTMIGAVPAALEIYQNQMGKNFALIRRMHGKGIALDDLVYLLPNAFPVRFYESGDLLNFFQKWKSRLCYTAQEEIFYATLDEVRQLTARFPFFEKYIGAPCKMRQNTKPICPEGDRYCGVKVWKLPLSEYTRRI